MKQTFAVVILLAALGVLFKLAFKENERARPEVAPVRADAQAQVSDEIEDRGPEEALRAKYPEDLELIDRVLRRYRQNALTIERTDGLRGLVLLDRLDMEAIFLYERYPADFRRLRDTLNDEAAADILLHWREYFGLKRADERDRKILIAEISRLSSAQRRAAAAYPHALPLILTDPVGVTELIERWRDDPERLGDALALLDFISLEPGAADLRAAVRTLDDQGELALEAFRLLGLDGFALVHLYGPVLRSLGETPPLELALILLRVNSDYVDSLLRTHSPELVASYLRHVSAAGLIAEVGSSPNALRLVVEYGASGERALEHAGPDAAEVVYQEYSDASLRQQAVLSMAEHGPLALAMLSKYAIDPEFRDILRTYGPAIIPPIASADAGPENLAFLRSQSALTMKERVALGITSLSRESGQGTIRLIKKDGLDRVAELSEAEMNYYELVPLYDVVHLGNVLRRGYSPTKGEMTWALIDGCFVVADVLSLMVLQPEGVVATELARTEVKVVAREAVKTLERGLAEQGTEVAGRVAGRRAALGTSEAASEHLSKWLVVRAAGGTFEVLRKFPEAMSRIGIGEMTRVGRPFCEKAGLRLSTWGPIRFLKNGEVLIRRVPLDRSYKYMTAQALQVGVGVVAFHKMEEHLASRRADPH
ncbi:hypothetical protein BH23PLA1_BH23PLA1_34620 [soil metagenome]